MSQVCIRLQQLGIEASTIEGEKNRLYLPKTSRELKGDSYYGIQAACDIQRQDIDYIFYSVIVNPSSGDFCLEFLVVLRPGESEIMEPSSSMRHSINTIAKPYTQFINTKTTRLSVKKEKWLWGKIVNILWKGKNALAQSLNSDDDLKRMMFKSLSESKNLKSISIYP